MSESVAAAGPLSIAPVGKQVEPSRTGEVLRDIARGGVAGVVAGIAVGGLGGRVVMRIAALLYPDAAGAVTENGNRIGEITLGGTLGLVLDGVISCAMAGAVWVIVSPCPGPELCPNRYRAWPVVLHSAFADIAPASQESDASLSRHQHPLRSDSVRSRGTFVQTGRERRGRVRHE